MASGYIYALNNPSFPGLLKIGCTSRNPFIRAKELQTTGVPTEFELVLAVFVSDIKASESRLHAVLESNLFRAQKDREFFKIELPELLKLISDTVDLNRMTAVKKNRVDHESVYRYARDTRMGSGKIKPDEKKAIRLYEEAAALGSADACDYLVYYFENKRSSSSGEKIRYYLDLGDKIKKTSINKLIARKKYEEAFALAVSIFDYSSLSTIIHRDPSMIVKNITMMINHYGAEDTYKRRLGRNSVAYEMYFAWIRRTFNQYVTQDMLTEAYKIATGYNDNTRSNAKSISVSKNWSINFDKLDQEFPRESKR